MASWTPPWRWGRASSLLGGSKGRGMSALFRLHSSSHEDQVARATLVRSFPGKFDKFVIPCVVASGDIQDRKGMEPLSFRCGIWSGWGVAG